MSSNILTTAHLNYLYWSNPTVLVSDPPAFRLPPSICYAPLHLIHHYRTSSSISLNRRYWAKHFPRTRQPLVYYTPYGIAAAGTAASIIVDADEQKGAEIDAS